MEQRIYQMCTRCVMDTTDTEIIFDEHGVCNHCIEFDTVTSKRWFPNEEGKRKLQLQLEQIKKEGISNEYDCILGLSGGVDSSYLALLLKDSGLRPLVVHVDAGWNSELAVYNIEQIVKFCNYELYTHVMNWEEIKDLQVAYLKAGVANQDVVQDHAFFSVLYHFAVKNNIKYVISGGNIATESVFPKSWHHSAMDALNLKDIHKKFGNIKLKEFKTISFFQYYIYYPLVRKIRTVRPLNFIPYNKDQALNELVEKVGYKKYGRKHGESRFTKFFQNYYLPKKFNMDKRKLHLSSMVLANDISRDQALSLLAEPLYSDQELAEDLAFVAKKLGLTQDELHALVEAQPHHYTEYNNWDSRYKILKKLQRLVEKLLGREVKSYA